MSQGTVTISKSQAVQSFEAIVIAVKHLRTLLRFARTFGLLKNSKLFAKGDSKLCEILGMCRKALDTARLEDLGGNTIFGEESTQDKLERLRKKMEEANKGFRPQPMVLPQPQPNPWWEQPIGPALNPPYKVTNVPYKFDVNLPIINTTAGIAPPPIGSFTSNVNICK